MKSKLLTDQHQQRRWVLIFDSGDEVTDELNKFARTENLRAANFTAIGAFAQVTVAWFDLDTKQYRSIPIDQQVEVLSLIGDVADSEGKLSVHAHICVAGRDGAARGGHLLKGRVRPTLEMMLTEAPAHLRKTFRPEFGLPLIDLSASSKE